MGFNDRGNSYRGGNRDSNRGGFRGGNSGPREMTKVTCSDSPFKDREKTIAIDCTVSILTEKWSVW